jgi:thiol-disulfide isomerase/thioredoxin
MDSQAKYFQGQSTLVMLADLTIQGGIGMNRNAHINADRGTYEFAFFETAVSHPRFDLRSKHPLGRQHQSAFLGHTCCILLAVFCLMVCSNSCLAQSSAPMVQLYFFTSKGCAPCRQVEPAIEALKQEGYDATTVHLDQHPDWAQKFGVDRTPTVIMVANNRIVGRHAGLIDATTLRQWFAAVGTAPQISAPAPNSPQARAATLPVPKRQQQTGSKDELMLATYTEVPDATRGPKASHASFARTPTLHKGTSHPGNEFERQALEATVRLKVQDKEGISYATGTVIHCHQGEWLVMSCGHAFREAGFGGKITAEYDLLGNQTGTAPGELIAYDANARDVALIAVSAGRSMKPVKLALPDGPVERGQNVFSIGCDGGDTPTIRHTQIKNQAIYDGAVKYDIHGRPAIGRSGGGLFNEAGELIGVCNAAAVETDEGIYSALDSIYWQLAQAKLDHLFSNPPAQESYVSDSNPPNGTFAFQFNENLANKSDSASGSQPLEVRPTDQASSGRRSPRDERPIQRNLEQHPETNFNDQEVIIIVRSKTKPGPGESITIENPTPQLLNYLSGINSVGQNRQIDMARRREAGSQEAESH